MEDGLITLDEILNSGVTVSSRIDEPQNIRSQSSGSMGNYSSFEDFMRDSAVEDDDRPQIDSTQESQEDVIMNRPEVKWEDDVDEGLMTLQSLNIHLPDDHPSPINSPRYLASQRSYSSESDDNISQQDDNIIRPTIQIPKEDMSMSSLGSSSIPLSPSMLPIRAKSRVGSGSGSGFGSPGSPIQLGDFFETRNSGGGNENDFLSDDEESIERKMKEFQRKQEEDAKYGSKSGETENNDDTLDFGAESFEKDTDTASSNDYDIFGEKPWSPNKEALGRSGERLEKVGVNASTASSLIFGDDFESEEDSINFGERKSPETHQPKYPKESQPRSGVKVIPKKQIINNYSSTEKQRDSFVRENSETEEEVYVRSPDPKKVVKIPKKNNNVISIQTEVSFLRDQKQEKEEIKPKKKKKKKESESSSSKGSSSSSRTNSSSSESSSSSSSDDDDDEPFVHANPYYSYVYPSWMKKNMKKEYRKKSKKSKSKKKTKNSKKKKRKKKRKRRKNSKLGAQSLFMRNPYFPGMFPPPPPPTSHSMMNPNISHNFFPRPNPQPSLINSSVQEDPDSMFSMQLDILSNRIQQTNAELLFQLMRNNGIPYTEKITNPKTLRKKLQSILKEQQQKFVMKI